MWRRAGARGGARGCERSVARVRSTRVPWSGTNLLGWDGKQTHVHVGSMGREDVHTTKETCTCMATRRIQAPALTTSSTSDDDEGPRHDVQASEGREEPAVAKSASAAAVQAASVEARATWTDSDALRLAQRVLAEAPCTEDGRPRAQAAVDVVAQLTKLRLGVETTVAGLLADAVHRGAVSLEQVEDVAGASVAALTHDAARLRALPARGAAHDDASARALRNFCLAFHDARSIAVALAWRLDLMRNSGSLPNWRQQQLALETMQIYAPLSHALRAGAMRDELEDRAFAVLFPKSYAALADWMRERNASDAATLASCETQMQRALVQDGRLPMLADSVRVSARRKSLFSTMRKLLRGKGRNKEDVRDLLGLRVVVVPKSSESDPQLAQKRAIDACYVVRDVARKLWTPASSRDKDYIAHPKSNGYQSLHSTLMVRVPLEQIQRAYVQSENASPSLSQQLAVASHRQEKEKVIQWKETSPASWPDVDTNTTARDDERANASADDDPLQEFSFEIQDTKTEPQTSGREDAGCRHVYVELQVRTEDMDVAAERGCASHSAYKGEVTPALTSGAIRDTWNDPYGSLPGESMEEDESKSADPSISMASDEDGFFSMFGLEVGQDGIDKPSSSPWAPEDASEDVTEEEFQELQDRIAALAQADARTQVRLQEELARAPSLQSAAPSIVKGSGRPSPEPQRRHRWRREVPTTQSFLHSFRTRWKPDVYQEGLAFCTMGAVHLQPRVAHRWYTVHAGEGTALDAPTEVPLPVYEEQGLDSVLFVWVARANEVHVFLGSQANDVRDLLADGTTASYTMVVGYVDESQGDTQPGSSSANATDVDVKERKTVGEGTEKHALGTSGTEHAREPSTRKSVACANDPALYVSVVGQGPHATLNGASLSGLQRSELWIGDTLALGGFTARLSRPRILGLPAEPSSNLDATGIAHLAHARIRLRQWREARDAYAQALDDPEAKDPSVRASLLCAWASLEAVHGDAKVADCLYQSAARITLDIQPQVDAIDLALDDKLAAADLNLAELASRSLRGRAKLETKRGAHRRARALYQRAVWISPWDDRNYAAFAKVLDPEDALKVLEVGRRAVPRSGRLLHTRACVLAQMATDKEPSMVEEARQAFIDAVLASPRQASRWLAFGKFERAVGDLDAAWKRYAVGLRVAPRHLGLLRAAAALARTRGDLVSAEALLRRAWDVDNNDEVTLVAMAQLARACGEQARADRDFARARKMRKQHLANHGLLPLSAEQLPSDVRTFLPPRAS